MPTTIDHTQTIMNLSVVLKISCEINSLALSPPFSLLRGGCDSQAGGETGCSCRLVKWSLGEERQGQGSGRGGGARGEGRGGVEGQGGGGGGVEGQKGEGEEGTDEKENEGQEANED
ncbi:hypothetical protein Pcinc_010537 [Petrolisthes cinctipes]|uniref:Uncharacterized protein n=1 Tax=Petrolisthes cinctipes TaxID=88211 RepID=A0AAE1G4K0_PETCI|nr:hypothetical protein Pcinc_010537 [Petrolisthes cinctipes]